MKNTKRLLMLPICACLLTSCSIGSYEYEIKQKLGIDIKDKEVVLEYESHGGFHNDGLTVYGLNFGTDQYVYNQVKDNKQWKNTPLPIFIQGALFGTELDDGSKFGPYIVDFHNNQQLIPNIEYDYYSFIDRQGNIDLNRINSTYYSFNFTIGLFNTINNALYFVEFDT